MQCLEVMSPKMRKLIGTGTKGTNENRIGYYRPLTFLDSQEDLEKTFGDRPVMLLIVPTFTGKSKV